MTAARFDRLAEASAAILASDLAAFAAVQAEVQALDRRIIMLEQTLSSPHTPADCLHQAALAHAHRAWELGKLRALQSARTPLMARLQAAEQQAFRSLARENGASRLVAAMSRQLVLARSKRANQERTTAS